MCYLASYMLFNGSQSIFIVSFFRFIAFHSFHYKFNFFSSSCRSLQSNHLWNVNTGLCIQKIHTTFKQTIIQQSYSATFKHGMCKHGLIWLFLQILKPWRRYLIMYRRLKSTVFELISIFFPAMGISLKNRRASFQVFRMFFLAVICNTRVMRILGSFGVIHSWE